MNFKKLLIILVIINNYHNTPINNEKNWHNLNAYFDFSDFDDQSSSISLSKNIIDFVKNNLFEVTKRYIYLAFKVSEEQEINLGNLSFSNDAYSLKSKYGNILKGYDFIWKVSAFYEESNVVGRASANSFHEDTDRPNVGVLKLNLYNLENIRDIETSFLNNLFTVIHEAFHSLGYNRTSLSSLGNNIQYDSSTTQYLISSPKVLEKARSQYGCPTLENLHFENNSSPHWEVIEFGHDIQMAIGKRNTKISLMTLAFFEDLGYYKMNYNMAEILPWGLKKGCDFIYNPNDSFEEFAYEEKPFTCSLDYNSQAFYNKSSLSNNLYIKNNSRICRLNNSVNNSCVNVDILGNKFSECAQSRCLYNESNDLVVEFTYRGNIFTCNNNEEIQTSSHISIKCPKIETFCEHRYECKNQCHGRGYCLNGDCVCNNNYKGVACEFNNNVVNSYELSKKCNFNGNFKNNKCSCFDNYNGEKCENIIIDKGSFGSNCANSDHIQCYKGDYFNYLNSEFIKETTKSSTENSEPSTENSEPSTENSESSTENSEPSTENSESSTEDSEPSTENSEPSTEDSEPSTENSEPSTEDSEPSTENSEPSTENSEPSTEDSKPITENSEPSTEDSEPSTEDSEQNTEDSEPSTENSEPSTENSEPSTEDSKPSTEDSEQSTEDSKPNIKPSNGSSIESSIKPSIESSIKQSNNSSNGNSNNSNESSIEPSIKPSKGSSTEPSNGNTNNSNGSNNNSNNENNSDFNYFFDIFNRI